MTDEQMLERLYSEFGNVNCIHDELKNSSENAVAIGFYLDEIKRCEYWRATKFYKEFKPKIVGVLKGGAYKYNLYTFYDYCHDEFNFSRRTVDRYLNIFMAFAKENKSGNRTKFIDDKYKDYNCSQLSEMLGLSDRERQSVNPDMTVKQIRNLKKNDTDSGSDKEPEVDSYSPNDVNIVFDKDFGDKTFKKKKYHVCGLLFDKFVSTPSQYTQQFVKLQEYLNKGYLARIVLYAPEDGSELEGGKVSNE